MPDKSPLAQKIIGILIVALWGALTAVVLFMGDTVRANDDKATKEHTAIRMESKLDDDKVRKELMKEISLLRNEQTVMRKETNESFTRMQKETNASFTKVLVAIAEIKKVEE